MSVTCLAKSGAGTRAVNGGTRSSEVAGKAPAARPSILGYSRRAKTYFKEATKAKLCKTNMFKNMTFFITVLILCM